MKAWNPHQLYDGEMVAAIEEDPSPVNTDESNEESSPKQITYWLLQVLFMGRWL